MKAIRTSGKALIIDEGRLLAIELSDRLGHWYALPGGGQESGETLHQALRRECVEEAGAEVEVGPLRYIREYIGRNHEFADEDGDVHQIDFMFECRLLNRGNMRPTTVPDSMQVGIRWLDIGNLMQFRLYPLTLRPLLIKGDKADASVYLGDTN